MSKGITLVLVMPPQQGLLAGFANALVSLASYIAQRLPKIEVRLIDWASTSPHDIEACVQDLNIPKGRRLVVGITTTTASYQSALVVARQFKLFHPRSTIIFGGHHASGDPETILRAHESIIDYIIVNEGERALATFLEALPDVSEVLGLAFLKNGTYRQNLPPPSLDQRELDMLPVTWGENREFGLTGKFDYQVTYVSARGCPLQCAFCAVSNEKIRTKSVDQVVSDVRELVSLGFTRIAIEDNFFAHSFRRTRELCGALAELQTEGVEFAWDCQTRVESMAREEMIPLLTNAGCEAVFIGVEALNPDHLIYLNKTQRPDRYLRLLFESVVPELLDSPVQCNLNLQLGIPGESESQNQHTRGLLRGLGAMAVARGKTIVIYPQLHVVYPGTLHFKKGVSEERFPNNVFETFTAWEAKQQPILKWLGEHFAHGVGGLPEGMLQQDLLREGVYAVDIHSTFRIAAELRAWERLPGIEVFRYGSHLVTEESDEAAGSFANQALMSARSFL